MQLTRSNDDPKLLGDLERLAGADPVPSTFEDVDDAFVRRFVQGAAHVRRYAPFYAGGALWLLVMLLIQPVGRSNGGGRETLDYASSASLASPMSGPMIIDEGGGSPFPLIVDGFGLSVYAPPAESPTADSSSSAPPSSSSDGGTGSTDPFPSGGFGPVDETPAGPVPLSILASGYSSASAGTPLEQNPPRNGLPVATLAGNDAKRSFIRLGGTDTVLRLKVITEGNATLNAEGAAVEVCPITTAGWTPTRGQKLDAGPAYDTGFCATGTAGADGIWTFDLGYFVPIESTYGFALVPGAGTLPSFQITFEPQTVAA